ncbi:hypothetical protein ACXWQW_09275, partial [Streptococcus pyogenes]
MNTLDDILKAVANMPTDPAEIDKIITAAKAVYDKLTADAGDNPTEEQVAALEKLAEAVTQARAAKAEAAKADAQAAIRGRRDRAAAAAAAFADDSDEGGSDDSEESEGADGEQDS